MRLAARLLINLQKLVPEKVQISDFLNAQCFDTVVQGVQMTANCNVKKKITTSRQMQRSLDTTLGNWH